MPGLLVKTTCCVFDSKTTAQLVTAKSLKRMPEQPDDYEPTEADIDMVIEDFTGKPAKPANLAAGIASVQQRIAQLELGKPACLDLNRFLNRNLRPARD